MDGRQQARRECHRADSVVSLNNIDDMYYVDIVASTAEYRHLNKQICAGSKQQQLHIADI